MPLSPGTKLGSYEILGPLGSGGMGDVYRARDAKLNREVAIKVLPERLASDPAALARFEREAQAVAALSHPNIMAIHDFGSSTQGASTITYAVTELLDGDTLRARLADGALPVRRAVDYGVHIARGIAAAHERGIVHRDLKPENIFVTNDGVVKILDFGLAKGRGSEGSQGSEATLGSEADGRTQLAQTTPGTVLGTVGYMSPEQVRGQVLDHRTDIFSFGAVLYEMLTGRRAFRGDSHVETMNAILKDDPPEFSEVNANLPGSLERIIRRCLEKRPTDRFHSAHDLAISLEALSGASNSSAAFPGSKDSGRSFPGSEDPGLRAPVSRGLNPVMAIVAVAVVGAGAFFAGRMGSAPAESSAASVTRLTYRRGPIWSARMAPDGATFVYSAKWDDSPRQIYSTRAESPESQALPYLGADVVSISSKSELAIVQNRTTVNGYAAPGTLARAPLTGGAARDVLEGVQDADWLPDGSSLAVSHYVNGHFQLEFPIGKVVYQTDGWIGYVRVSPDGQRVAFLDQPIVGDDRGTASVIGTSGPKQSMAIECESARGLAWAPSGKEVWFTCSSAGTLSRALVAGSLDGHVRTVYRAPGDLFLGDIGADGSVLLAQNDERQGVGALPPGETRERDLSWLDWTQPVAISDDGKTLLLGEEGQGGGAGYSVYLRKTDGTPAVRLGTGLPQAMSPDGRWIIAQKIDTSPVQYVLLPTGAGQPRALTSDDITHGGARFLPDGKRFAFNGFKPGKPPRGWVQALDGGAATPFLPEGVVFAHVTPDGTRVVARDTDGQRKLFPIDPKDGEPTPIKFLDPAEFIIRFTADGHGVFLRKAVPGTGLQVLRLDLATGVRTPLMTVMPPPEAVSMGGIGPLLMSADGRSYVYGYGVTHSDLFLIKGLR